MHQYALEIMEKMLSTHVGNNGYGALCYDVGSFDVNGTFKHLIEKRNFMYKGIDISAGKNVDIVIPEYNWNLSPAELVISGNCMEHVRRPWDWIKDVRSICNGTVLLQVPYIREEHKFPIDCWRILPDGMEELLTHGGFKVVDIGIFHHDCYGVGKV